MQWIPAYAGMTVMREWCTQILLIIPGLGAESKIKNQESKIRRLVELPRGR
jgi:hypothetical protein